MLKKVRVKFEFVIVAEPGADFNNKARAYILDAVSDMSSDEFMLFLSGYKDGSVTAWDGDYGGDGKKRSASTMWKRSWCCND